MSNNAFGPGLLIMAASIFMRRYSLPIYRSLTEFYLIIILIRYCIEPFSNLYRFSIWERTHCSATQKRRGV